MSISDRREKILIDIICHQMQTQKGTKKIRASRIKRSVGKYIRFMEQWKDENEILKIWTQLIQTYSERNPDHKKILQPFLNEIISNLRHELRTVPERALALTQWELIFLACNGHAENIEILRSTDAGSIAMRHLKSCSNVKSSAHIKRVIDLIKRGANKTVIEEQSSDYTSLASRKFKNSITRKENKDSQKQMDKGNSVDVRLTSEEHTAKMAVQIHAENNLEELKLCRSREIRHNNDRSAESSMEVDSVEPVSSRSSEEYFTAQGYTLSQEYQEEKEEEEETQKNQKEQVESLASTQQNRVKEDMSKGSPVRKTDSCTKLSISPGRIMLDQIIEKVNLRKREQILREEIFARRRRAQQMQQQPL